MPTKHPSEKLLVLPSKKEASFLSVMYKNQLWDAKLFTYIQLSKSSKPSQHKLLLSNFPMNLGFFVHQINPYVQAFYKTGDDVTIHTIEGEIRENVGQLQVYCTRILTFSPEIGDLQDK